MELEAKLGGCARYNRHSISYRMIASGRKGKGGLGRLRYLLPPVRRQKNVMAASVGVAC